MMATQDTIDAAVWREVVSRHFALLESIYQGDKIGTLRAACGVSIPDQGRDTVVTHEEVERYIDAVGECMGPIAMVNARIFISRKLEELGAGPL